MGSSGRLLGSLELLPSQTASSLALIVRSSPPERKSVSKKMTICLESNWFSRKQVLHNLAQNYRGNSAEIRGDRCHICISLYFAKSLVRHSAANFGRTVSSQINHGFMSKWDALKQFSHGLWTRLCFFWGFDWYFHGKKESPFNPLP